MINNNPTTLKCYKIRPRPRSAEAETVGIVSGLTEVLGAIHLLKNLGIDLKATIERQSASYKYKMEQKEALSIFKLRSNLLMIF